MTFECKQRAKYLYYTTTTIRRRTHISALKAVLQTVPFPFYRKECWNFIFLSMLIKINQDDYIVKKKII